MRKPSSRVIRVPPIVSIIGRKNSGKTTLLERLIPAMTRRGFRVGTLKHHHYGDFEADTPGKDSWRHARAGAVLSGVLASGKVALFLKPETPMTPEEIVRLFADHVDLVLTEGFSHSSFPRIEVVRKANGGGPLSTKTSRLLALLTDGDWDLGVRRFGLDGVEALADFLALEIRQRTHLLDHGCLHDSAEIAEPLARTSRT